ncbi:MAG: glycogen debranching N-terminal domain-containing protein [Thermoanaerobaculia bacterium]
MTAERQESGGTAPRPAPDVERLREALAADLRDEDRFYILATSSLGDDRPRVLKEGETFAVFDHYGDVPPVGLTDEGIYHQGTRHVSSLLLRTGKARPLFLSSTVREDNALLTVDLTNPDLLGAGGVSIPRGSIHLLRTKFLWQGTCHECLRLRNYGLKPVRLAFSLHFAADFVDVFEVRGLRRKRRGRRLPTEAGTDGVLLAYEGLDGVLRRTRIRISPEPARLGPAEAELDAVLDPGEDHLVFVTVTCESDELPSPAPPPHQEALEAAHARLAALQGSACRIHTSNHQFNDWVSRSVADLSMMVTDTASGPYPYAGVPWYSTAFGRDGLLTAFECLWVDPEVARGVLTFLAAHQAEEIVPEQDAEPGKILHETRRGEMAALGEIPFGRYYGSVDATPLFIVLAGAFYRYTGDTAFVRELWPHLKRALQWIDEFGDLDGDGFVEYRRRSAEGLDNQGWKDSHDSVFHADGSLAPGPIALCEVQAYVYAARLGMAEMAAALGRRKRAAELRGQAEELRERFEAAFWCEELGTYAIALDGRKHPCRVVTSNPGHCLLAGIAAPERAARVAETLMDGRSFSGWGVRTLAEGEVRYNPMSYHNGSVWPHDNALVAQGLARYAQKDATLRILDGLFDACLFVDLHRMPELFCGFDRRPDSSPTLYPVACAPQAWAAASVFMMLQACLGLEIDAPAGKLHLRRPLLPPFLEEVELRDLRVGPASVDLRLHRRENDVSIDLLNRQGDLEVLILK